MLPSSMFSRNTAKLTTYETVLLLAYCKHYCNSVLTMDYHWQSDNGTEFTNQLFAEFTRIHNITHTHKTLPHSPKDNGSIERFHSTILEHIRILKLQQKDEPVGNLVPYAIIAYNSSIHSFTKCRPFDLLNGHFDPRDPVNINLTKHILQQYAETHRQQMKQVYDLINESSLDNLAALTLNLIFFTVRNIWEKKWFRYIFTPN